MLPPIEPFFPPADVVARDLSRLFFGQRWAFLFGAALLALLSLTTVGRWLASDSAARVERIVQRPVAPETSTFSSQTPDVTAPDPGDAPP